MNTYYIEYTDLYGSDPYYRSTDYYRTQAKSVRGALRKLSNKVGVKGWRLCSAENGCYYYNNVDKDYLECNIYIEDVLLEYQFHKTIQI